MRRALCVALLLFLAIAPRVRAQEAELEPEPEVDESAAVSRLLLDDVTTQTEPAPALAD